VAEELPLGWGCKARSDLPRAPCLESGSLDAERDHRPRREPDVP
jgi:hypothetical protein